MRNLDSFRAEPLSGETTAEDEAIAGCIGGAATALFGQGTATRGNGADEDAVRRPYSPSPGAAAGTGGDGLDLSDDPMSMYLRNMRKSAGFVLSGEAALAKRTEVGRRTTLDSLCARAVAWRGGCSFVFVASHPGAGRQGLFSREGLK